MPVGRDSRASRSSVRPSAGRDLARHRRLSRGFELLEDRVLMAVPENLDEMFARQARHATATWGAAYLENPTTFQWQPETFMYYDVTTGHEVWKMTNTPGLVNFYHNDTSMAVWSADGKRIATCVRQANAVV